MLEIGALIDGKYKILNKIGGGGMGTVYLALNERLNKTWAIKVARQNGLHDNDIAIQSLTADKKTLIGLSHPNLPSIVDVYEDEQSMMIVMDYIEGNPLSITLEEFGAQPQEYVIGWARQLCDVLGYLHSKNIIYRDLKPANIMLKPDGNITLIDFGTAREYKEKNNADTQNLGTKGYAAPEQFGGQGQTDARTDIYGIGATVHHLITGIDPQKEPNLKNVLIREVNPSLSGGLEKIVEKCLRDKKEERYQSCGELMYALKHYEKEDDLYKRKQKRKLAAFIGTTALAVVFAIISTFGYVLASNQLRNDYDLKVVAADNPQLTEAERERLYLEAIQLDGVETTAYLSLIDLFLESNEETGRLSREEAAIISQLEAGIDNVQNGTYVATVYPLEILKSDNFDGYEQVCYEIGLAYWYDYQTLSARYTSAVKWFGEAATSYPIAAAYMEIGECKRLIEKYAGQNRTGAMYESYRELWEKLLLLKTNAETMTDSDTRLLVWKETVRNISDEARYFMDIGIGKEDMLTLLSDISEKVEVEKNKTDFTKVKEDIDKILTNIEEAKLRVSSASSPEEETEQ